MRARGARGRRRCARCRRQAVRSGRCKYAASPTPQPMPRTHAPCFAMAGLADAAAAGHDTHSLEADSLLALEEAARMERAAIAAQWQSLTCELRWLRQELEFEEEHSRREQSTLIEAYERVIPRVERLEWERTHWKEECRLARKRLWRAGDLWVELRESKEAEWLGRCVKQRCE